jgi:hypothetical protein
MHDGVSVGRRLLHRVVPTGPRAAERVSVVLNKARTRARRRSQRAVREPQAGQSMVLELPGLQAEIRTEHAHRSAKLGT